MNNVKDVEIRDPPTDSISNIAWSRQSDLLAVASWDSGVRVYEINNGLSSGKAMYNHNAPVLTVAWSADDTKVVSGGTDNKACVFDIVTQQVTPVVQHDAPIRAIRWIHPPGASAGILATGSWDKTLRYWDLRAPMRPAASILLSERCYTMDAHAQFLTVGTADRNIQVFDMNKPTIPYRAITSPLRMQIRVITSFASTSSPGFAIGSVEGRVAMHYLEDKDRHKNYSFKCHRSDSSPGNKGQTIIHAVNDIRFHPIHETTFSTCGSDGLVYFWDRDARQRLKTLEAAPGSITTSAFNRNGTLFAYAISYDWSKGHAGMTSGYPNKLMLHRVEDIEVKPRSHRA